MKYKQFWKTPCGNSFDFKFSKVLESVCFKKEPMRYKIRIRAPTALPTTESNKGRQLLALASPALVLHASQGLYAKGHFRERLPPLTQSPRSYHCRLIPLSGGIPPD
ncbi:hypothetical protein AVEN_61295-1 [Araneus ventricosus]|uniref:Uncharacterized protein n=1 Tax=Araneus ventricosus TaxID=182803 RepID=A0A4Y2VUG1_ARAVE|nr:hypothetical protein AVEN_61295-1 [Araneus ventricosus]